MKTHHTLKFAILALIVSLASCAHNDKLTAHVKYKEGNNRVATKLHAIKSSNIIKFDRTQITDFPVLYEVDQPKQVRTGHIVSLNFARQGESLTVRGYYRSVDVVGARHGRPKFRSARHRANFDSIEKGKDYTWNIDSIRNRSVTFRVVSE